MRAADQISNTPLIANARMYSSGAPEAGAAWTSLLSWVVARVGCGFEVLDYPPPKPLDAFWARSDLGCAFMCGLPYARDPRPLTPIVALSAAPGTLAGDQFEATLQSLVPELVIHWMMAMAGCPEPARASCIYGNGKVPIISARLPGPAAARRR